MKRPCDDCPWRLDAPPRQFEAERFRNLWRECQDDGRSLFACHKSREGEEIVCAGFVLVVGFDSIGLRIAVMFKRIDPTEYGSDVPLHESFEAMLRANGIEPPPRNRRTDR